MPGCAERPEAAEAARHQQKPFVGSGFDVGYVDADFDDDANPFGDKLPWREENKSKDRKKPRTCHPDTHWDWS